MVRDGAPLAFRGKAQKKPLELLKALVALGGEGVETGRLAAILWPEAAGDAAKVSFDSTLYRLRKLLEQDARSRWSKASCRSTGGSAASTSGRSSASRARRTDPSAADAAPMRPRLRGG